MGIQNFSFFKNTSFNLSGEPLVKNTTRRDQELRARRLQSALPTGMANTEVAPYSPLPLARLLFKLRS